MAYKLGILLGGALLWLIYADQGGQASAKAQSLSPLARLLIGVVEGEATGFEGVDGLSAGEDSANRALLKACDEISRMTPLAIDEFSDFVGCTSGNGLRLTFTVRLSGFEADRAGTQDAMSLVRRSIAQGICRNPDVPAMTRLGITLVYRYVGSRGKLVGDVVIGRTTCTI